MQKTFKSNVERNLQMIAVNLERRMRERGFTEDALADASEMSPRTVGNFLRPGNRKSIRGTSRSFPSGTIANLCKIAQVLDVDVAVLFTTSARAGYILMMERAYEERVIAEREAMTTNR